MAGRQCCHRPRSRVDYAQAVVVLARGAKHNSLPIGRPTRKPIVACAVREALHVCTVGTHRYDIGGGGSCHGLKITAESEGDLIAPRRPGGRERHRFRIREQDRRVPISLGQGNTVRWNTAIRDELISRGSKRRKEWRAHQAQVGIPSRPGTHRSCGTLDVPVENHPAPIPGPTWTTHLTAGAGCTGYELHAPLAADVCNAAVGQPVRRPFFTRACCQHAASVRSQVDVYDLGRAARRTPGIGDPVDRGEVRLVVDDALAIGGPARTARKGFPVRDLPKP